MRIRRFLIYLGFEIVAVIVAMASFRYIEARLLAGAIAGASFVSISGWIFIAGLRRRELRLTASFVVGAVFLFAVAIPMMAARFWNPAVPFAELNIWGLPGPEFHKLSTNVYSVLLAATVLDAIRAAWFRRATTK